MWNVIVPDNDQASIEVVRFDDHPEESAEQEVVQENGHSPTRVWFAGLVDAREEDDKDGE